MKLPVEAWLLLPDSRTFVIHKEIDDPYKDSEVSYWTWGNMSCDCNRALEINREYGLDLPVECGDEFILTSLKIGGKEHLV